jgi:aminocarboxymuconate-semialdehyde decarboxylase
MLIDVHAHHLTPAMFDCDPHWGPTWSGIDLKIGDYFLRNRKMPAMSKVGNSDPVGAIVERFDYPFRRRLMDEMGVDKLVLSISPLFFMYWTGDFGVDYAKLCNDELARWCAVEPDKFLWWATAPMHRPEEAAAELERAVGMGAVGLYLAGAGLGDYELHSPELDVVWAKVNELGVPLFVHGYPRALETGAEDPLNIGASLGYLHDESAAFWNLICGGVLDRFPNIRVYITHAGGFVPYQLGRLAEHWETLAYDAVNELPLLDYLPRFYFDPMIHDNVMRRALVEMLGVDRFVYGSNFSGSDQIDFDLTEGIGLSEADREAIKSGNAIELLNLQDRLAVKS